jgi:hypothetical protein
MKKVTRFTLIAAVAALAVSVSAQLGTLSEPWEGKRYALYTKEVSWPEAQWLASQQTVQIDGIWYRGGLATITSPQQNEWIWKKLGAPTSYWLGGWWDAQKTQWTWSTGRKWSYANWAKKDGYWSPGKNACLAYGSNGTWAWWGWESKKPGFIIQFEKK